MKKKPKTRAGDLSNPNEPAPPERAALDVAQESSSALRVKISEKEGVPQIHAPFLLIEALGTTDPDFLDGILCHCSATSKRTRERCKAPAVRGWTVCRFHGARGGGPRGKRNGMFKHGLYTKEALKERRLLRELLRQSRRTLST